MIVITQSEVNATTNCQVCMCYMNVNYEINGQAVFFYFFLFVSTDTTT
jgi:hypothetical protein